MNKKCKQLGCTGVAATEGYCSSHYRGPVSTDEVLRDIPSRPHYHSLYNSGAWGRLRMSVLSEQPVCQRCQHYGITRATSDIDHIIPHKGDRTLFHDRSNLQGLCNECHGWKTAREQGARVPLDFRRADK